MVVLDSLLDFNLNMVNVSIHHRSCLALIIDRHSSARPNQLLLVFTAIGAGKPHVEIRQVFNVGYSEMEKVETATGGLGGVILDNMAQKAVTVGIRETAAGAIKGFESLQILSEFVLGGQARVHVRMAVERLEESQN